MSNVEIFGRVRKGKLNIEHFPQKDVILLKKKKNYVFNLRKCWSEGTNNNQIFETLFNSAHGHNKIYWLAFGYTGSGKTYTINSLIENLFKKYSEYKITASCYQIYNKQIYDVLNLNKKIVYRKASNLVLNNLTKKLLSPTELFTAIDLARAHAPTTVNHASSRSHLILRLEVNNRIFTLVDLAGQEVGKTAAQNDYVTHKEAVQINLSLLSLKECIRAIANKSTHIPYRRSTLTMALKPMFKKENCSAMVCTLYPKHINQTIDTLKYASSLQNPKRISVSKSNNIQEFHDYLEKAACLRLKEEKLLKKACCEQIVPKAELKKLMNDRIELVNKYKRRLILGKSKLPPLKNVSKVQRKIRKVSKPTLKPLYVKRKKWKKK